MLWWQSVLLGIVQGVTEFLPISSDGHLVLVQDLLGLQNLPVTFDILLHSGTLLATVIFFWRQLRALRWKEWLIIGSANIPVVVLGVAMRPYLESLAQSSLVVAGSFLMTSLFLWIADAIWFDPVHSPLSKFNFAWESLEKMWNYVLPAHRTQVTFWQAGGVGLLQALALLPGVSRSGSTLLGGAIVGLTREQAFPFAFLLGVPAILGAVLFDITLILNGTVSSQQPWGMYLLGAVCSGVVGWFALKILSLVMQKSRLRWFAIYCLAVSILSLFVV